ncbi:MAG TPA: hypothetical protein PK370_00475 [Candidatus Woesebacteria bacterium]|nr:hypothetical protein [Candidatus Woesebacteria bacterium]
MTLRIEHDKETIIVDNGNYYNEANGQIYGLTLENSTSVTVSNPLKVRGIDNFAVARLEPTFALIYHGQGVEVTLKNGEVYRLIHQ